MENVKDVRVLIAPDPTQSVELKGAVNYIGEKRRRLEAADVQNNSDLAQLLLHDCDHQPCALDGGSFHGDVKTHAISERIAGRVKQRPSFIGVVIVGRNVSVV